MIEVARVTAESSVAPEEFHARWVELETHPEWSANMEFLRLSEPTAVGARGVLKLRGGRESAFVVTALEPGRVYADTTLLEGAELTVHHEAQPRGDGGSRLTVRAWLTGDRAEQWAAEVGDGVQHDLQADLDSLVALLERESSP